MIFRLFLQGWLGWWVLKMKLMLTQLSTKLKLKFKFKLKLSLAKSFAYKNIYFLFATISEHLLGYIVYSFDRFCSSTNTKGRKVGISEIWIRGKLTCYVDSATTKTITATMTQNKNQQTTSLGLSWLIPALTSTSTTIPSSTKTTRWF